MAHSVEIEGLGVPDLQNNNNHMDFFPTSYNTANDNDFQASGEWNEQTSEMDNFISSHEGKIANPWTGAYDDEAPLLEELGINLRHIATKLVAVLHPTKDISPHIMDDTDMAGPLVICLLLGVTSLLRGRVHFSYIYGFGVIGCVSTWLVLNLMSKRGIDIVRVVSVLGYCLLPMVILALCSIFFPLAYALLLASTVTLWCARAATQMFVAVLQIPDQRWLIAYPIGLIYACFAMMSCF